MASIADLIPPIESLRAEARNFDQGNDRHCLMRLDDDPDLPLVRAIASGDAAASRMLVDRHLPRLHAMARRLLDDASDADDVCQDVLLAAWRGAAHWKPGRARFATWLHQVALNACRDRLRRRKPLMNEAGDLMATGLEPDQQTARNQMGERVRAAVRSLPERQREALVLCHLQGYGGAESAAILGISVEALESLLARARRTLRAELAPLRGDINDHR